MALQTFRRANYPGWKALHSKENRPFFIWVKRGEKPFEPIRNRKIGLISDTTITHYIVCIAGHGDQSGDTLSRLIKINNSQFTNFIRRLGILFFSTSALRTDRAIRQRYTGEAS